MSVGIEIQFLAGRYHATPWNHQVNEGIVEWPPSPMRILRALVGASYRLSSPPTRTNLCKLLTCLTECLPIYVLPEHTIAHTRHYMPIWREGKLLKNKVFDTFVVLPEGALSPQAVVKVVWQMVELNQRSKVLLELLCQQVNYLGRSESWVAMRVIDDCTDLDHAITLCNAFPALEEVQLNADSEQVQVLVPLSSAQMKGWIAAISALPQPKKGKNWNMTTDVLSVLSVDIGNLYKEGWNGIPGAHWVTYVLQKSNSTIAPSAINFLRDSTLPKFARFALASKVLPNVTQAIAVGELFRQALMALSIDSDGLSATVFSGRKPDNEVESIKGSKSNCYLEGNRHAWYLPEVNLQGQIDHVVVYAAAGFDDRLAVPALKNLSRIWNFHKFEIQTILVNLGQVKDYAQESLHPNSRHGVVGLSRFWRSLTPVLLPRHPKRYRNGVIKFIPNTKFQIDGPEDQALKLLTQIKYLSLSVDNYIKVADDSWLCLKAPDGSLIVKARCCSQGVTQYQWLAFKRHRHHGDGRKSSNTGYWLEIEFAQVKSGPIALGYAAHFGLGVFVPVRE